MKPNFLKYFLILLGIAPILFFIYYVWKFTINVPFLDDTLYYTKCIVDVNKSKSISEAFWIFMKQHTITEHRTPVSKFMGWLIYQLTGKLNYTILAHIGNLSLLGILFLFWRFFKKHQSNIIYFLPIPFLLFQMQTYENQFWTICNWTYYPIGLFQMLVLYFLSYQKPNNLIYAVLTAILATFTFSNGMFVFLPACLVLIFQKRYKDLGIFVIVAVACVVLYFSNYKPSPINAHKFSISSLLTGFVLMLGDYIDVQHYHKYSIVTSTIAGLTVLLIMTYGLLKLLISYLKAEKKVDNSDYLFITSSMVVLCMSAGAVAYTRYSGEYGFEEMFVSRYRFISVLMICLGYLFVLFLIKKESIKRIILVIFLPLTIILYLYSYYFTHENNVNFRERLVAATFNFKFHNSWVLYSFNNDWTYPVDVENLAAIKTSVYELPNLPFTKFQEAINKDTILKTRNLPFTLEEKEYRFVIKNLTFDVENPLEVEQNIVLKSKKYTYILPLRRYRTKSKRGLLFHQDYFWKGFESDIFKNTFIPDEYTIGFLKVQNDKYDIQYSNLKVKL